MAVNVYDWDADPAVDRRLYPLSNKRAGEMLASGLAKEIALPNGRRGIQKLPPIEVLAERAARNSITPFGKGPVGLIKAPPKISYPIPAVCDHRLSWLYSFMNSDDVVRPTLSA